VRGMRVAFISEHASPRAVLGGVDAGGQNVYVDEVSRNVARLGHQVDVFTRRDGDLPEVLSWAPGVRIVNVPVGPPTWVFKDDLWPLMPAFRDEMLRFMECEGIHYDVIHANFWMSSWVGAELRSMLGVPLVQIFHATGLTKQRHQGAADTSPAERIQVERRIVREADRSIAQCPAEERELVDDYGADPEKVAVIPSAVNVDAFRPIGREEARRAIGVETDDLVIGYIGRMLPRKDVRNLVRATAILLGRSPLAVRLLLVGGETPEPDAAATPEIGVLQRRGEELGISDRMIFIGKRQPDVLCNYYSASDVVVTTPWYEPFGLTPLEAMACGRPVIGSAVGGISFTVEDGETGFLVPPRDPEALATRLEDLLTQPRLRERMGRAARRRVEARFTWPVVARRTGDLYEQVTASKSASIFTGATS
jgi:D-inositol-3-phosphate glycosyltransferase